ncbi:hypothetical protein [Trichormus azollae]|uniref:hypothetical protein n=1 Tax=Trichormus azollae TaxID=1164 RepID=UPI0005A15BE4|nr:hypothetical protein [Trichormus azollae]
MGKFRCRGVGEKEFRSQESGVRSQESGVSSQESGVRIFEKLVNYQIGIFEVSLKKQTADGCSRSMPLGIS